MQEAFQKSEGMEEFLSRNNALIVDAVHPTSRSTAVLGKLGLTIANIRE